MNVVNSSYHSTEQNLYTIIEMVCEVCQKNLNQFQNFKSTYTPEWIQNLLGSAQAASAMPNNHTRLGTLMQCATMWLMPITMFVQVLHLL